ncbi:MAG: type IX secretion system sortase PorU, partial [Tannerellaceae bacterium]|nr:type IX secretion system sortase PorU [Tannerellaceae bacterium]
MRVFLLLLLSVCCLVSAWADDSRYAARSVLSSGMWMKIKVEQTGICKITYDDLRKMGFADPSRVSVHGYGGWPLDEDFGPGAAYIDDLPPVAVYRGADYLLFYGKGPVKWEYSDYSGTFVHTNNPYATYGSYFLTDATEVKEMEKVSLLSGQAALNITVFDDYRVHEEELYSVNNSGRELFGESFETAGSRTIPATSPIARIEGITDADAKVTMRFIARPRSTDGQATLSIDGQELMQLNFPAITNSGNNSYIKAIDRIDTATWRGEKNEAPRVVVSYNKSGDENVRLDYIRLHVKRALRQYGGYTFFRSIQSIGNVSRFVVGNVDSQTVVFDVTGGEDPKLMETQLNGTELSFSIPAGDLREFAAVQINQSLSGWTREETSIDNQNLHACLQTDMVIIAADAFHTQAERLAERHRADARDSLSVLVVSPRQVYNEFSSGTPDATAYRRFMKMFYDRNEAKKPRYLLLFGDGSYDNRKLTNNWKEVVTTNMLLTYQSENSLSYYSYVTDDYFGALKDERFTSGPIQLGIGRFPVRTVAEATAAVDKVVTYMDNKETGAWKNRICFVADDG